MNLDADLIGMLVAAFLTLCVFSYLLKGDFFLYRLAVAILTGGGAAYISVIVFSQVIPRVYIRLSSPGQVGWVSALVGLLLGALVLFKGFPRQRMVWLGNYSVAYLIGVGAAVSISGAALGTLLGQGRAAATIQGGITPTTGTLEAIANAIIMLAGTLTVLISFAFLTNLRRGIGGLYARIVRPLSAIGRVFLALAFGAIFASVYIASISVLTSRIQFMVEAGQAIARTFMQSAP